MAYDVDKTRPRLLYLTGYEVDNDRLRVLHIPESYGVDNIIVSPGIEPGYVVFPSHK
jgi:hypothetical protein